VELHIILAATIIRWPKTDIFSTQLVNLYSWLPLSPFFSPTFNFILSSILPLSFYLNFIYQFYFYYSYCLYCLYYYPISVLSIISILSIMYYLISISIGSVWKWGIFNLRTGDRILMKFDAWKNIVSQSSYFKSRPGPVTLGELRSLKSWKMLRVEELGWNLLVKICTSPRYVIDITGNNSLSLGELGRGELILKN